MMRKNNLHKISSELSNVLQIKDILFEDKQNKLSLFKFLVSLDYVVKGLFHHWNIKSS
jgi:hypothetical protein